ncbi:hypothetical protein SAMN06295909_1386 [Plantibacter sp. VKM Ac-1784]|uniref:AAA+ ATPase domain-containing protein n=1 Tax=Plantibacter elymi (nom. nud.) TaxID=199708 RepID=A0ABY1RAS4_9MICO|nr:hypothetical protein [Plantibacter sp. VKM Ac-1784]SMQ66979.1 hypothetical protein SAMN06295909_1386 [Plantibacter sp. VKM Ac-1784]
MAIIQTSDVFTPAELPKVTDVDRSKLTHEIAQLMKRKSYISLTGGSKLGKTTFLKSYLAAQPATDWSAYLAGQSLANGAADLWLKLAQALEIPTSKETGLANGDKTTWGVFARLSLKWVTGGAAGGVKADREENETRTTGEKFTIDPEHAVTEALKVIRANDRRVIIAIDDFHFVQDHSKRHDIVVALRPLTDAGCKAFFLSTVLGGDQDPAFNNTNTGGRRKSVEVLAWELDELKEIATKGFKELNLWADDALITDLASESFGSPQIMQQLCLDLCENENGIYEREAEDQQLQVNAPADRDAFFRSLDDDEAIDWLKIFSAAYVPRRERGRYDYPSSPPVKLDGYQLILYAIHEMGSPTQVAVADVKRHVGDKLKFDTKRLNKIALEQKSINLGEIAARDMTAALTDLPAEEGDAFDEADEGAEEDFAYAELVARAAIPQPVLEVKGKKADAVISILDPLFSYMLKWHPDVIVDSGRK